MLGDLIIGAIDFVADIVIGAVTGSDDDDAESDGDGASDTPAE
jgi:hypothetical protein